VETSETALQDAIALQCNEDTVGGHREAQSSTHGYLCFSLRSLTHHTSLELSFSLCSRLHVPIALFPVFGFRKGCVHCPQLKDSVRDNSNNNINISNNNINNINNKKTKDPSDWII